MTKPTLIERLEAAIEIAENSRFTDRELLAPVLIASKKALEEREWVKIEDIPEEWKDGREIDLGQFGIHDLDCRWSDCTYDERGWADDVGQYFNDEAWDVTHAMLPPPQPPEQS